ncbi:hypothetical protein J4E89_009643 [Alternaria sp. Ai002NY15]|nr:hypothetical protein J4E89_009643 [Alternaria sp. Ai002NY15]
MENTHDTSDSKDIRSFKQSISHFEFLESQMGNPVTVEIFNVRSLLMQLRTQFDSAVAQQSRAYTTMAIKEEAINRELELSHGAPDVAASLAAEAVQVRAEYTIAMEQSDSAFDRLRDALADQVLTAMEVIWQKLWIKSEDAIAETLALKRDVADVEASYVKKERALQDEYGALKKNHYRDLQQLVELRVRDEKIKLTDRLSTAETKASHYTKALEEKKALEARIVQESREKAALKQAKLEWEQKYKERDEEAKTVQEGYEQLSNDNQALQTEKAVLQADYDEMKNEHEQLPKERKPNFGQLHVDPHVIVLPDVSLTTAVDRQAAELQHLDGLVTIWQTTLENATAEMNESTVRKEALEGKMREAEQQLKKLKPALSQKTPLGPSMKSKPKGARKEEHVVVNKKPADEDVLKPSVNTSGGLPEVGVAAEAFPALSSPAVPKTILSTTWKSLRLVDLPKEDAKDVRKKSG